MSSESPSPSASAALVGRSRTIETQAAPEPLALLAALLESDRSVEPGALLPPLWHWVYFARTLPQGELGPDGHPRHDDLLPDHPGMRRMWAGSRLAFAGQLRIGERLRRRSTLLAAERKQGRQGPFLLLRQQHAIEGEAGGRVVEEQDIAFREPAANALGVGPAEGTSEPRPDFERVVQPDAVLLFRYSAATNNSHRIHYDHPYATEVEGYPGLVVHGPLMATLMLDLLHRARPRSPIASLAFRAEKPAFLPHDLAVRGRERAGGFDLWIESAGRVASRMSVESAG
jgi:3-methylfumaryl-CoA hydratase